MKDVRKYTFIEKNYFHLQISDVIRKILSISFQMVYVRCLMKDCICLICHIQDVRYFFFIVCQMSNIRSQISDVSIFFVIYTMSDVIYHVLCQMLVVKCYLQLYIKNTRDQRWRLQALKMHSQERHMERYRILYMCKYCNILY